jgi:lipopolysaccharide transport system permease protein
VLPLYLAPLALFSLGLSWIAAALQVYLRDTAQVLTVVLTVWFWMTPIFIEESKLSEVAPGVVTWNPLTYFVRSYRDVILGGSLPALSDAAAMVAFGLVSCILGGLFVRQTKRGFADVL